MPVLLLNVLIFKNLCLINVGESLIHGGVGKKGFCDFCTFALPKTF